jgi:hypothetical protein
MIDWNDHYRTIIETLLDYFYRHIAKKISALSHGVYAEIQVAKRDLLFRGSLVAGFD